MDNNLEYRPHYICNCCDRTLKDKVIFKDVRFAVNPKTYQDFYQNNSICSHCLDLISEVFGYDFSEENEGLLDNYNFFKTNQFFKLDSDKFNEDDIIFIFGISPSMTEDYHILYVEKKDEEAVNNTVRGLMKRAENNIRNFKDLLR